MEKQPYRYDQIEDLLADDRFIYWVENPDAESDNYWNEWVGTDSGRREMLDQAILFVSAFRYSELKDVTKREELVWEKIDKGDYSSRYKGQANKSKVISLISSWKLNRIAAIALILVVVGSLFFYLNLDTLFNTQPELITIVTKNGEKKTISLPDGTEIYLNSGSQLSYPSFFKKRRDVNLTGEAFFKVAKDKTRPFVVHSRGYTTQALGTSFNVKAYSDEFNLSIALKTGKVVINNEKEERWKSVFLEPGEKLNISSAGVLKSQIMNDDLSWQDGVLVLNQTGFDEFVRIIERWYGVNIEVTGLPGEDWMVNGRFKNKPLAVVLESVSFAENIDYTLQGDQVKLSFR